MLIMFYVAFNNISDISWRSVLLVKEIRVHGRDRMVVGFITTFEISAYQH
jgi:hypothetical protein